MLLIALCANVGCNSSPEAKFNNLADAIESELELNSDQVRKLETIKVAMLEEYKQKMAYSLIRNPAVDSFLMAEKLDKTKVKAILESRKRSQEAKVEQYFPMFEDFHSSLSIEQKQKLAKASGQFYRKIRELY